MSVHTLARKRREKLQLMKSKKSPASAKRSPAPPPRDVQPGSPPALEGLQLEITPRESESDGDSPGDAHLAASYRFSESGAFVIGEFEIGRAGLRCREVPCALSGLSKGTFSGQLSPRHFSPPQRQHAGLEGASSPKTPSRRGLGDDLVQMGVLGHGACSTVWKALHVPSLRIVAQKVISIFEENKRRQMVRELRALYRMARLEEREESLTNEEKPTEDAAPLKTAAEAQHAELLKRRGHIVDFYDAFVDARNGSVSVLVEYMDGGSLQDVVDAGGCPHESVLANVAWRILNGLTYLHDARSQMHRDIKPANLLINHRGDVKIGDFGIAREFRDCEALEGSLAQEPPTGEQNALTFVGTVTYMSPERLLGEPYDAKADIWAMGITLMTCALGEFPYAAQAAHGFWGLLQALREDAAPELPKDRFSEHARDFVRKCMRRKPEDRPHASELLKHPFVSGCAEQASRPPPGTGNDSEDVPETVLLELDQVVNAVKGYYQRRWSKPDPDDAVGPIADKPRLAALAFQLGAPERLVRTRFAQMAHELRDSLT
ncbi:kinase-like domain-containing protein [Pelagophyceae sp. CCMP2097]|nr:kinase-like domain-containing protein [Pelagophyceae sp. CCMP2097]